MLRCVLAVVLEGFGGHAGGRGLGAEVRSGRRATYATRRAIVGRIVAVSRVV